MTMKPGKREIAAIAKVLEQEHETVEAAAGAALELAWELYEKAARFITVIQEVDSVTGKPAEGPKLQGMPRGNATAFMPVRTITQAANQSLNAVFPASKQRKAATWVLPVWNGTPASWWAETGKRVDGVIWGVRQTYVARCDNMLEAISYAEDTGGTVVQSKDDGDTWEEVNNWEA